MSILRLMLLAMLTLTISSSPLLADAALPAPPAPPQPTPPTATRPVPETASTPVTIAVGVILISLGVMGARLAGAFRRQSIRGPLRLAPGSPVLPIVLILIIGGGCWLGGQMLFFVVRGYQHARATGGQRLTMEHLDASDMALLATVPSLVALLIVLAGDVRFGLLRTIGLRLSQLPRMLLLGIVAGIVAMLLTYGASSLLGVFYQLVDYEHPSEHELLGAMKQASAAAKVILAIGACVMAPLFEEVLFRGHMQTLLTRLFARVRAPARMAMATTMMPQPAPVPAAEPLPIPALEAQVLATEAATPVGNVGPAPAQPPALPLPPLPVEYASPVVAEVIDLSAMRWLAVILTSIVFAVIHPLWTAPLIFLLSVCLGYAYERTGSLWVPIVMHAMFNTSSTLMFLLFM
jgi:membrane protease YdiL (CAAX protease family)